MSSTRKSCCAALFALFLCASSGALAQPGPPEGRFDASRKQTGVRVTLVDRNPAAPMDQKDLLRAVAVVTHEVVAPDLKGSLSNLGVGSEQATAHSERGPLFNIELVGRSKEGTSLKWDMLRAGSVDVAKIVERLKQVLAAAPKLTPEEGAARLEQLRKERDALWGKQSILGSLVRGQAEARKGGLNARLERFDAEREALEIDLAAAEARAEALRLHMAEIQKQVRDKADEDPIRTQLERVLEARRAELKRVQDLVAAGHGSSQEIAQAEGRIAEAEIQLLTRREQVMRGDEKGDLLGRLANELAMLSIDQAEKDARLRYILRRLPQLNPKGLDEKALERIAEEYPTLVNEAGELPPLYYELDKRMGELFKEELALLVSDVRVESDAATAPAP